MGATIGQSLPNWGPVANEGRGRTVAMTNLYTDRRQQARLARAQTSVAVGRDPIKALATDDRDAVLMARMLHEATHNLGPAHEYEVTRQDRQPGVRRRHGHHARGAQGAERRAVLHRLVQSARSSISPGAQRQTFRDSITWAFGHIARGMYTPDGQRKAYSQLAAIQIGFLMDQGAIRWDDKAKAANGKDTGAFVVDFDKLPAATTKLMTLVATIKAKNDKKGAEALAKKYVDGKVVPQKIIAERFLRFPKTSFVYSLDL